MDHDAEAGERTPLLRVGSVSSQASTSYNTDPNAGPTSVQAGSYPGSMTVLAKPVRDMAIVQYENVNGRANTPIITCAVCQKTVDMTDKRHLAVVKCLGCNEATPVREPAPDKHYVRCECSCLLIAQRSSKRIVCPRPKCKRLIKLVDDLDSSSHSLLSASFRQSQSVGEQRLGHIALPGMTRVVCVLCRNTFLHPDSNRSGFATCPNCHRTSAVGANIGLRRGRIYSILALITWLLAFVVLFTTLSYVSDYGIIYIVYIALFVAAITLTVRSIYYYTRLTSGHAPRGS